MIKKHYNITKKKAIKWVVDGWNSDSVFGKGKVIFVGVLVFFILWKIIYSIFV
tara:strand:+ start:375 stop:533 length:159 start_codon:yes stop_codon:yes gene_type:complete